jgi:nucleoid-associated protein YgaU
MHLGGFMFKVIKKVVITTYLLLVAFLLLDRPDSDPYRGVSCDVPQVVVRKDDTLWDIAVRHCGGQRDGDIKVSVIKDLNQDVVDLDVGMVIIMPQKSVAK